MREINECTAEVFRRSEKRIKERRRKRNRIVALCIPLFLIVTVWSVMLLPATLPANHKNMSAEEISGTMDEAADCSLAFVQVEIETGADEQSAIVKNDANEVAQIYYMMQSSFVATGGGADEIKKYTVPNADENRDLTQTANSAAFGHKVIFTAENGAETVFIITRDKLINESTNEEVTLTEAGYADILTALGLTVTREEEH